MSVCHPGMFPTLFGAFAAIPLPVSFSSAMGEIKENNININELSGYLYSILFYSYFYSIHIKWIFIFIFYFKNIYILRLRY